MTAVFQLQLFAVAKKNRFIKSEARRKRNTEEKPKQKGINRERKTKETKSHRAITIIDSRRGPWEYIFLRIYKMEKGWVEDPPTLASITSILQAWLLHPLLLCQVRFTMDPRPLFCNHLAIFNFWLILII